MFLYKLAVLRAFVLQQYYNLKSFEQLPYQLIHGDFSDNRVIVPIPQRKTREEFKK